MGRPKKPPHERRKPTTVGLTQAERDAVEAWGWRQGLGITEAIRALVLLGLRADLDKEITALAAQLTEERPEALAVAALHLVSWGATASEEHTCRELDWCAACARQNLVEQSKGED